MKILQIYTRLLVLYILYVINRRKSKKTQVAIVVLGLVGKPIHDHIRESLRKTLGIFDPDKKIFTVLEPRGRSGQANAIFTVEVDADSEWGVFYLRLRHRRMNLYFRRTREVNYDRDIWTIFRIILREIIKFP